MKKTILELICDLACKLENIELIGSHQTSDDFIEQSVDEVKVHLVNEAGVDFGSNLIKWVDWYFENYDTDEKQKINLLFVRVAGRINVKGRIE